jgi:hypothetical protein
LGCDLANIVWLAKQGVMIIFLFMVVLVVIMPTKREPVLSYISDKFIKKRSRDQL